MPPEPKPKTNIDFLNLLPMTMINETDDDIESMVLPPPKVKKRPISPVKRGPTNV